MKTSEIISQFNNCDKLPYFEIPVIDKRTNEETYLLCKIQVIGRSLVAQYEPLNTKQAKSKYIANSRVVIDNLFSLDENLQFLYDEIINRICESEFFEVR